MRSLIFLRCAVSLWISSVLAKESLWKWFRTLEVFGSPVSCCPPKFCCDWFRVSEPNAWAACIQFSVKDLYFSFILPVCFAVRSNSSYWENCSHPLLCPIWGSQTVANLLRWTHGRLKCSFCANTLRFTLRTERKKIVLAASYAYSSWDKGRPEDQKGGGSRSEQHHGDVMMSSYIDQATLHCTSRDVHACCVANTTSRAIISIATRRWYCCSLQSDLLFAR